MIVVFQGLPGAGKSMLLARTLIAVLYRNRKWYDKKCKEYEKQKAYGEVDLVKPKKRYVYHNLQLSKEVNDEFSDMLRAWHEPAQLTKLRNVDVFWDEIATHLDATQWASMSLELKRWLQQHRKFGLEIYGTTQDFAQVDISFRRLTSDLIHLSKLCGSRDISATSPPPKHIWGLIIKRTFDPVLYDEKQSKMLDGGIPVPMLLHRSDIEVYDTTAEVPVGEYPPMRHIERKCDHCSYVKTSHV